MNLLVTTVVLAFCLGRAYLSFLTFVSVQWFEFVKLLVYFDFDSSSLWSSISQVLRYWLELSIYLNLQPFRLFYCQVGSFGSVPIFRVFFLRDTFLAQVIIQSFSIRLGFYPAIFPLQVLCHFLAV